MLRTPQNGRHLAKALVTIMVVQVLPHCVYVPRTGSDPLHPIGAAMNVTPNKDAAHLVAGRLAGIRTCVLIKGWAPRARLFL
jgi:hypothetical protein